MHSTLLTYSQSEIIEAMDVDFLDRLLHGESEFCQRAEMTPNVGIGGVVIGRQSGRRHVSRSNSFYLLNFTKPLFVQKLIAKL